jgi:hypothetical protein
MATSVSIPGLVKDAGEGILAIGTGGTSVEDNPKGNSGLISASAATESAATAVPDFLSRLTSGSLWLRVGEVVLGIALIIVGLEKISNLNVTGKLATAGKAAAFL